MQGALKNASDWQSYLTGTRGLPAESEDDLLALLFRGGLSTKAVVTELSGRGAGVGAAHAVCRDMGGTVAVISERGRGTTFRFCIPDDDAVPQGLTSAA